MTIFYQNKTTPTTTVKESPYQQRQTTTIQYKTATTKAPRQPLPSPANKSTIGQVVIPYTKGIAKSFKHICGKYGIQVHFKGNTTIKQVLMKPKDKDPRDNKSGVIYSFQCSNIACNEEYIEETSRTLGERCKEHLKHPSPIYMHIQQTGHNSTDNSFNIIGREDQGQARDHQGSCLHKSKQYNLKSKYW